MTETTLDDLLEIIENPTRRMILREIVRERRYPLQLSHDLNISQQAVMKHLRVLKEKNLVKVVTEKSDAGGPPRKCYTATQMFSITIDVGPSLFNEAVRLFKEMDEDIAHMEERALGRSHPVETIRHALSELGEIEGEMRAIEERRAELLRRKEGLRKAAYEVAEMLCDTEGEKRVLTFIIENGNADPDAIAEGLNMRDKVVRQILKALETKGLMEGEL
ncbi:MAG: helix-turn-helix domain-containing protein [Euryarchaeota archaeon]|nr:helix-turn-helix domain-containing protein [Euryarchaeota archaeon]